jgi:hypothetical protein
MGDEILPHRFFFGETMKAAYIAITPSDLQQALQLKHGASIFDIHQSGNEIRVYILSEELADAPEGRPLPKIETSQVKG